MISIHNHLGEALENADYAANLDEHAKELLADKTILAEIIQRLIPEFRGIATEEIQTYINGTPYISKIHLDPGVTNPSFEEAKPEQFTTLPDFSLLSIREILVIRNMRSCVRSTAFGLS